MALPIATTDTDSVTVSTTLCQFMGIHCRHILSQYLKIGLRFSHVTTPDVWLVGRGITTKTKKDFSEVL